MLSERTIWTADALSRRLQEGNLFLSLLRTYELTVSLPVESEPIYEQLYKFIPLPSYINASTELPVYSDEAFAIAQQEILGPEEIESELDDTEEEEKIESILDSPDWIEKISETGNSSNGQDFEKLVRKGLVLLGFSNSQSLSIASIDPEATGGAGGLDFYADRPYALVGECKASATDKVGTPAKQLYKLAVQWLEQEGYENSVKLVIAAGEATVHDKQFARNSRINVIRPEAFQALVALKLEYEELLGPAELKTVWQSPPFGKAANQKLLSFIGKWKIAFEEQAEAAIEFEKSQRQAQQIVQTVKELSRQPIHTERKGFSVVEVRSHYNAKYQPCLTDEVIKDTLAQLTSPFSVGCLRKHMSPDGREMYAFKKDMILSGS